MSVYICWTNMALKATFKTNHIEWMFSPRKALSRIFHEAGSLRSCSPRGGRVWLVQITWELCQTTHASHSSPPTQEKGVGGHFNRLPRSAVINLGCTWKFSGELWKILMSRLYPKSVQWETVGGNQATGFLKLPDDPMSSHSWEHVAKSVSNLRVIGIS